jgi:tetrahydromethanopterin S-methyltransferase subunit G
LKKRLKEIEEKIEKVAGEISLSILAYNVRRGINIVGLKGLILAL